MINPDTSVSGLRKEPGVNPGTRYRFIDPNGNSRDRVARVLRVHCVILHRTRTDCSPVCGQRFPPGTCASEFTTPRYEKSLPLHTINGVWYGAGNDIWSIGEEEAAS